MKAINNLFRLQPGEGALVIILGFLLLGNSIAVQVSGIAAVSGFLSSGGVNTILIIMLIDFSLILLVSGLQTLIIDRFDRFKLVGGMCFIFALLFTVLRLMFAFRLPNWLNYSAMYLISEQQYFFFPLFFWVLANDVCSMAQAKRLFPLISSLSFIGKLLGIGLSILFPMLTKTRGVKPEEALLFNVVIYLLAFSLILYGANRIKTRQTAQKHEAWRETIVEGWEFVREVPSFRFLMLSILATAMCYTVIEFRFLVVSNATFPSQINYQQFYSLFRLGTTLAAWFVQMFLTSRIINSMNLRNVFFTLPALILVGAVTMLFIPGLFAAVAVMALIKLIRETIDESACKSFQALVPEERRGRVSTFMDSYIPAIGIILSCLITGATVLVGIWLGKDLHRVYLSIAAIIIAFAVMAIFKMRREYDRSLLNWRLKRRQRGSNLLDKLEF